MQLPLSAHTSICVLHRTESHNLTGVISRSGSERKSEWCESEYARLEDNTHKHLASSCNVAVSKYASLHSSQTYCLHLDPGVGSMFVLVAVINSTFQMWESFLCASVYVCYTYSCVL